MKKHFLAAGAMALSWMVAQAGAQTVPGTEAPALARQVCVTCHGPGGRTDSGQFPSLAGQSEAYLLAQLKAYRDHSRANLNAQRFMWGVASWLSEADLQSLATYYAAQPPAPARAAARTPEQQAAYARGQALFQAGEPARGVLACVACHGAQAQGLGAIPRLAGQNARYLAQQLAVFKGHDRADGAAMAAEAGPLTPEQVHDLALYLQAL